MSLERNEQGVEYTHDKRVKNVKVDEHVTNPKAANAVQIPDHVYDDVAEATDYADESVSDVKIDTTTDAGSKRVPPSHTAKVDVEAERERVRTESAELAEARVAPARTSDEAPASDASSSS